MNIHVVKGSKRNSFVQMKNWAKVDLCAVVESWLKDEGMVKELIVGGWEWFGKDRAGSRGGGIGFLVKRELGVTVPRSSKSENLLWIELGGREKLYVSVVYLVPKDRDGRNSMTLCELQEDII